MRPLSVRRAQVLGMVGKPLTTSLLEWYRSGADVPALMPSLSTWLGHGDPASTFWYPHASPELLALAAKMLQDSR